MDFFCFRFFFSRLSFSSLSLSLSRRFSLTTPLNFSFFFLALSKKKVRRRSTRAPALAKFFISSFRRRPPLLFSPLAREVERRTEGIKCFLLREVADIEKKIAKMSVASLSSRSLSILASPDNHPFSPSTPTFLPFGSSTTSFGIQRRQRKRCAGCASDQSRRERFFFQIWNTVRGIQEKKRAKKQRKRAALSFVAFRFLCAGTRAAHVQ